MDKNGWRTIESAPKDGTIVWLRNVVMVASNQPPILGRWGDIFTEWRKQPYLGWVSEYTPDDLWPFPAGRGVIPDEWKPRDPPPPENAE